MVFLFVLSIIILIILTIRIKIEFSNFNFTSQRKQHLNTNYEIKVKIYTFQKIPIFIIKINNNKMKKIINNEKIKHAIKEQEIRIMKDVKYIKRGILRQLKNIRLDIKEMKLNIFIGTENASLTAFIIPVISTMIAIFLSKNIKKYNENQIFSITPVYINQNLINIEFSGIFQIEMIHIINAICIVNKKRKGDKNERTSNRRTYDYSYEQH